MYERRTDPLLPIGQFIVRVARHLLVSAILVGVSLVMGIAGYMSLAHMALVDSFLNASMLLGGMGPVGDLPNNASKIFAGCFALYAGLIFIVAAGIVVAPVAHRLLHALHVKDS